MIAVAIIAGYANRDRLRLKIASVTPSVPPKAAQTPQSSKRPSTAFRGDAPWALSALPECFEPESKTTGPLAYVLAHLGSNAQPVRSMETLHAADCTVRVRGEEIDVDRGADRLRIPPPARLYRLPGFGVALLRGAGHGFELRTYRVGSEY